MTVGAPSYWCLYGLPSPYLSRSRGSSFERSSASTSLLEVSTSKASEVAASTPSIEPLASTSRRSWSKPERSRLRSSSRSTVTPLRVMFSTSGPFGLNGAKAWPRNPVDAGVAPGEVLGRVGQADERRHRRVDRPLHPGDDRAEARPAADDPQVALRPAGVALVEVVPARPRRRPSGSTAALSIRPASRGKTSQISTPGTLVAIGLNSPRISAGASGLRSNVSWCGRAAGQEDVDHGLVAEPARSGPRLGPGPRTPPRRGRGRTGSAPSRPSRACRSGGTRGG